MRLLANENFPLSSVLLLMKLGYDIIAIGVDHPGSTDQAVIELAEQEHRLIITFDRDYGELIYRYSLRPERGVLYLRLGDYLPEEPGLIVHELLSSFQLETNRRLTVYDGQSIRQRIY